MPKSRIHKIKNVDHVTITPLNGTPIVIGNIKSIQFEENVDLHKYEDVDLMKAVSSEMTVTFDPDEMRAFVDAVVKAADEKEAKAKAAGDEHSRKPQSSV